MPGSWQEDFLERLVESSKRAGDPRLATAALHRRKKTASYQHPQLRWVECLFDTNRINGNPESQVFVIECAPRRGTELDESRLRQQFSTAGLGGDLRVEEELLFVQYRWGFGRDASFPVSDARRVEEVSSWTTAVLRLLFDHLEANCRVLVATNRGDPDGSPPQDYAVALEQYLEDLLVSQWDSLSWAQGFQYLGRQVVCGDLGRIDILAKDRSTGDYVVIELKRQQGDDEVVGQLCRYMGWILEHRALPAGVGVRGIIVAHQVTPGLRAAALAHPDVELYTYELTVALQPVSLPRHLTTD
jgi:hypothetical protein